MRGVWGFCLGSAPGLLFGVWAAWSNPFFLDRPYAFLALACTPGLLLALIWRRPGPRQLLVAPLAVWALAALRPEPGPVDARLLVIGLDGATWDRVDALDLPHLEALQAEGQRGTLESMEPMFSPLLWTTIASGKPPEQHGVRGFRVRSDQAKVARFWDVAEAEGLSVGLFKWLVTWPPRPVDGFIVPAWLASTPETHPAELSFIKELELSSRRRRQHHSGRGPAALALAGVPRGLRVGTLLEGARQLVAGDRVGRELLRARMDRDVFVWALHRFRPDLATFTFYATDSLQHSGWGTPTADRAYRAGDALVGELLAEVGDQTLVVVLSDHGFQAFEGPETRLVPKTARLAERLDAEVYRLGRKLVAVGAEREAVEALLDEEGQPVYRVEELELGVLGLTLRVEERPSLDGTVGGEPLEDYAKFREQHDRGDHHPDGIFLVRGMGHGDLGRLQLVDVAPTLYAMLGIPPARDLPGRVVLGPPDRGPATRDDLVERLDWGGWDPGRPIVDEDALEALGYIER